MFCSSCASARGALRGSAEARLVQAVDEMSDAEEFQAVENLLAALVARYDPRCAKDVEVLRRCRPAEAHCIDQVTHASFSPESVRTRVRRAGLPSALNTASGVPRVYCFWCTANIVFRQVAKYCPDFPQAPRTIRKRQNGHSGSPPRGPVPKAIDERSGRPFCSLRQSGTEGRRRAVLAGNTETAAPISTRTACARHSSGAPAAPPRSGWRSPGTKRSATSPIACRRSRLPRLPSSGNDLEHTHHALVLVLEDVTGATGRPRITCGSVQTPNPIVSISELMDATIRPRLSSARLIVPVMLMPVGAAMAQGTMMGGGEMGTAHWYGSNGAWLPLFAIVVVGAVLFAVLRRKR